eukprot:1152209-Pelagomonas_calceolata.AAC.2
MIITITSEVVRFNFKGSNLLVSRVGQDTLAHKDSFGYLRTTFCRILNMAQAAENASHTMLASAYEIFHVVG